ncbi:MAG: hypothetical protein JKY19_01010 [Alcanivoracaceae bacterium]|nr:hypothetical protein [Alcanivoracaceae bacterium]
MSENELQPKLLYDALGRVHLLYFKIEDPKTRMGNLYYKQYQYEENTWSKPIQISQKTYRRPDVIATAKLAADGQGRLHVTWLGQKPTGHMYSRSDLQLKKFESPRSLVSKYLEGAEASAVISAYKNQISLSWMAGWDEKERTVYSMTSSDGGQSFGEEKMIGDQSIGGCGCCAYASDYDSKGDLLIAYRSATNGNGRHMQLLSMTSQQKSTQLIDTWEYSSCPVSTNNLARDAKGNNWLTWETAGKIYTTNLKDGNIKTSLVREPKQDIRQKHPAVAFNNTGYKVIVWSEGNGYFSGGELQIQLFDPKGNPIKTASTKGMSPTQFGSAAVSSLPDGSFLVLY